MPDQEARVIGLIFAGPKEVNTERVRELPLVAKVIENPEDPIVTTDQAFAFLEDIIPNRVPGVALSPYRSAVDQALRMLMKFGFEARVAMQVPHLFDNGERESDPGFG